MSFYSIFTQEYFGSDQNLVQEYLGLAKLIKGNPRA